jgi:thiamine-monophosphate kinase
MSLSEFDIISRFFNQPGLTADAAKHRNIVHGIGDDAAVIKVPRSRELVLSMDVLVSGVHFPVNADAALIAKRALAVNLSDLAAMGADPLCFTLGLTMTDPNPLWLEAFGSGLRDSAMEYDCPLVGGNLSKGPLQIAIQVQGLVPTGKALLRSGARPGHDVWVSGQPGRAGLALEYLQGKVKGLTAEQETELRTAYYCPRPRLSLGRNLRGIASAAQDISDGLLADTAHLAKASGAGITLEVAALPLAGILTAKRSSEDVFRLVLSAGDDYELVFTAPANRKKAVEKAAAEAGVKVTRIGKVVKGSGLNVMDLTGMPMETDYTGFMHFS